MNRIVPRQCSVSCSTKSWVALYNSLTTILSSSTLEFQGPLRALTRSPPRCCEQKVESHEKMNYFSLRSHCHFHARLVRWRKWIISLLSSLPMAMMSLHRPMHQLPGPPTLSLNRYFHTFSCHNQAAFTCLQLQPVTCWHPPVFLY